MKKQLFLVMFAQMSALQFTALKNSNSYKTQPLKELDIKQS